MEQYAIAHPRTRKDSAILKNQARSIMRRFSPMILLPFLLLSGLSPISGCGRNLTPVEHVTKAKEYMDKGEYRPALIELNNALQKDPKLVEGRWLLAKVAANLGEGARAEKEINKATELGLSRASSQATLVKAILLQGDLDRVLAESGKLPPDVSNTDQAAILGLRGQAFIAKGQFDLAQQALEQALQIKSDSVPALIGMTALNGYQRHYDIARLWVEKALKADSSSVDAWSALGDLELAQGKLAEAEKAYDSAIKLRSTPYFELAKRAQVRTQLKKFPEAAADIKSLQDAGFKDHPYVNYIAGLNYFAQKNYQDAATAFQASYQAVPAFLPNRIYLATTHLMLGNTEQALKHVYQILAAAPRSRTAKNLLGSILISRAEYDGAKDILQKTLTNSPNDPQALGMMASVAMLEGDTAKGLEYAKKLAVLEPDSIQAQDMLMTAKLIAGEALDKTISQVGKQATAAGDAYTRELMLALAAFRDNKLKEALELAKALHARYPDKVDPLKLMAACYLAATKWDQGKIELEKVLKLQPNETSATRNLAKVEALQGNYQRVKTLLQPLLKSQPGDVEAAQLLAGAETRLGNPAAAIEVLEQASKSNPNDLNLRAHIAQTALTAGRPATALDITRELTDTQFRQQPGLLELRGKALLVTGDGASASSTFERWTKIAPNSAPAHFQYANALASLGDTARARKMLERAIKIDPRYSPARVGEIKMRVQFRELDQAKKALAKLRQDFGDRAEVLGIEGWFALGTGDYAAAEQKLAAALKKAPDSELVVLSSRAQWAQKKREPALKTLRDWLKDHPNDVLVHMQLAGAYLDMGKDSDALATYGQVVKLAPNHVPALNNLAWLNRDIAPKQAMEYAQQAFQRAPKDPYVLDTLGMLTLKNGDLNRAASLLRDATQLAPEDTQIQLHLGSVLLQQKRLPEARKIFDAIVKKAPGSPAAKEAQALLGTFVSTK
jgi:putative PEP-CTERM system TPR-repeat lipoprotein